MGVILNNKHIVQYLFEVNNTELNGSYVINTQLITDSVEVQHSRVWNIQIGLFNSNGRYIRIIITPTTLTNGNIKAILTEKI